MKRILNNSFRKLRIYRKRNLRFDFAAAIVVFLIAIPLFFLGLLIHPFVGIALAICGVFIIISIMSAAQTIFISAVYHDINGDTNDHFNRQMIDNLFEKK